MRQERLGHFMDVYGRKLAESVIENPGDYAWPIEFLPTVLGRMRTAIERGSFNKDSSALRAACKELGIKHTYKAISAFLGG